MSPVKIAFKVLFIHIFLLIAFQLKAQIGRNNSFTFLNIPSNPVTSGLGGINISKANNDPNGFLQNPALLDSSQNNLLAINYLPYFSSIKYSSVAYVSKIQKQTFGLGIQYVGYGDFQQTDASGNILGKFSANDFAITLSHARKQGNITFGGNLKYVGSVIESYSASALLLDFGGIFKHPNKDFSYALTVKNIGIRLKDFSPFDNPDLPLDVQMGISFKPQYMPVRFSLTAHHLYKYDITYLDKSIVKKDLSGNIIETNVNVLDNMARHLIFGAELLFSKNFNILVGYNHLRSKELSQQNLSGFSGFSVGFLFKTKKINFSYSYSGYNTAGNLNSFGLVCDLGKFIQ
ncbi:type IX secretion system protein PorQ [Arcicella sp. LKC2W]|uniref:type IX secretion system protein PorQ n=1 Tax=Arcicella sp. LKC2W TaxID=2984198 RepID=UPI002B21B569|nr:type IX secretion system protein PorQ [Arcicella sp. LKC2W]MEA5460569.1 type IX secretion system protein PorQ [Arcicella sp. LKC2W]